MDPIMTDNFSTSIILNLCLVTRVTMTTEMNASKTSLKKCENDVLFGCTVICSDITTRT